MPIRRSIASAVIAGTLVLVGCSSDTSEPAATTEAGEQQPDNESEAGSAAAEVAIVDFAYDPPDIEITVGGTVTFTNEDSAAHTATAQDDAPMSFDTDDLDEGATAEITFDEPGDHPYFCTIHDYMKGTVRVLE